ncbi:MAG: BON domain-containing protein [Alphaproteobacteria bacterium]|nr:BON domain-containing protein [Alphaproteobacteria bacterium]
MTLSGRYTAVLSTMAALAVIGCQSPTLVVLEDPRTYVEERGIFVAREDARIRLDIQALYIEQEVGRLKNVTVDVYEGAVLLTGTVVDVAGKSTAGALAASVEDANPIYNEIQILPDAKLRDAAADLAIETKIKKELRAAEGVSSANLRWHCVNGTIYMFGRALSTAERELAMGIVGRVPGVKTIVDRINVAPLD